MSVKSEITLKITESFPIIEIEQGKKKVILELEDEVGFEFLVEINSKSYRKALNNIKSYSNWVASISGKLGWDEPSQKLMINEAGLQIFEKKAKEPKEPELEKIEAKSDTKNIKQSGEKIKKEPIRLIK